MHRNSQVSQNISPMNPLDPDEFQRQGHLIVDFLADYFKTIEDRPVRSQLVEPGCLLDALPRSAPHKPESFEVILEDIRNCIVPGLVHWQSPSFFGYFPSSSSTAGILGDVLCSGFNVVTMSWATSPAATELENRVMDWLAKMLELPATFMFSGGGGGVIQGSTCEAIICTMTAVRDKVLREIGEENLSKLVVYGSDQTHCSFHKAAHIVGISTKNIREIKTTRATEFGMCPDSLRHAINSDIEAGLVPLYLCATIGTTSTTAVDPIKEICRVVEGYNMWVHVDAAYAGAACICPEYGYLIDGIEYVDSFSLNAYKWLMSGQDCCCVWLRDPTALTRSLSPDVEYLRTRHSWSKSVINYRDWQISLGRRFKAIRLWLILRSHGVAGLRDHIRRHVKLAKLFEELVIEDDRFELFCKRRFALVCFRISSSALSKKLGGNERSANVVNGGPVSEYQDGASDDVINQVNKELLEQINGTGKVFMTHAVVGGTHMIRFVVGATLVEERHVRMAWKLVQLHADAILSGWV